MATTEDIISTLRQGRPVTARMAKQIIASLEQCARAEQGLLHMCGLYQREISKRKDKVIFTREECEMVEAALNKLAALERGGAYGRDDLMALAYRLDKPWPTEPDGVPRVARGVLHRVGRLKAIGNGQVPACAVMAWNELSRRIE